MARALVVIAVLAAVAAIAISAAQLQQMAPRGYKCPTPGCLNAERVGNSLTGKYPWWTGVPLGNPEAKIRIDAFLNFACDDCLAHFFGIVLPLLQKYGNKINIVFQPFALPYLPYSYDASLAAWAVYRLTGNNTKAFIDYASLLFNNQNNYFNAYELSQSAVWHNWFGKWATTVGVSDVETLIAAMNGTTTTANYDAWYSARFARQHPFDGAPSFLINEWYPIELHLPEWTLAQWTTWIDQNL